MAIFNIFGKKDVGSELSKTSPFKIATEWVPYKLYANRKSSSTLYVRVKNNTNEVLLTSVIIELPDRLGFDDIGLQKQREIRVGDLAPAEEKELKFGVYNGVDADSGEYTVTLTAIAHYRDYGHILNAIKKRTTVDIVEQEK